MKFLANKFIVVLLIVFYFSINLYFLTDFPFVHSDESWLSGLSRNILEKGSFGVTEAFFDLKPRNPHAIKILFHSLQIFFIKLTGYSIFTFRFISLLFGMLCLALVYLTAGKLLDSKALAFSAAFFLASDVQFIYASHFARQEIIILFFCLLAFYRFISRPEKNKLKDDIIIASIIGAAIGIHPNSFIISLPFLFMYAYDVFCLKKSSIKSVLIYILTLAVFASFFVGLSLYFDPDFFRNYASYGSEFEVFNPITSKVVEIKFFYQKLYYGISGTYYTPDIRFQLILFPLLIAAALIMIKKSKDKSLKTTLTYLLLSILGINTGIILIGRYNQTSVVLLFPFFYLLAAALFSCMKNRGTNFFALLIGAALLCSTVFNVLPYLNNSYDRYLEEISHYVDKGSNVLANLNAEYYFNNGRLFDYRNLGYLQDYGISFEDYIRKNHIEYIIYSEEMEVIYEQRPKWNGLYGSLSYYEDMKSFMENKCVLIHEFTDSTYGIRIARYVNKGDWFVKIYKVLQ